MKQTLISFFSNISLILIASDVFPVPPTYIFPTQIVFIFAFVNLGFDLILEIKT